MMAMHHYACLRSKFEDMAPALFPHAAPSLLNTVTTANYCRHTQHDA